MSKQDRKNDENLNVILELCRKANVSKEELVKLTEMLHILEKCRSMGITSKGIKNLKLDEYKKKFVEQKLSALLKRIGIPANMDGYKYIRYAIMHMVYRRGTSRQTMEEVYTAVAKKFDSMPSLVKRSIFSAIETAWKIGDASIQYEIFGATVGASNSQPKPSVFLRR